MLCRHLTVQRPCIAFTWNMEYDDTLTLDVTVFLLQATDMPAVSMKKVTRSTLPRRSKKTDMCVKGIKICKVYVLASLTSRSNWLTSTPRQWL